MSWFRSSILFLLLGAVSGSTLGVTTAHAQVPQFNYGNFSQNPSVQEKRAQLIKELQLNPSQIKQLKAVRQKFHGQKQKHNQLLTAAKEELANLMASNSPTDKIRAQRDRVKTLQLQLADLKLKRMMATKKILTTEQWAKLQKMKQQRAKNLNSNS
jgi:Spy/CpxP family protein refolding chaperone